MSALGILWFILIAVLIAGYFALDGFDLGAGVLYPFIAKDETDKMRIFRAIGPVWDGNEVWLLTAGGALFASFAGAYACVFSGFYLAIMLVLFGLILRAVALEYRSHSTDFGKILDGCFFVGSLLPALLLGVACGNLVLGIPLNENGDYTGSFFALLHPFALLSGVLGLVHMLNQGASWIALKAPADSELRARAAKLRRIFGIADLAVFAVVTLVFGFVIAPGLSYSPGLITLAVVGGSLFVLCNIGSLLTCDNRNPKDDLAGILTACLGSVGLVVIFMGTLFPNLVPATDPALSLTIANSASSDLTLIAMTIIAVIGVPIVLIYHVLVYRAFRGRVK